MWQVISSLCRYKIPTSTTTPCIFRNSDSSTTLSSYTDRCRTETKADLPGSCVLTTSCRICYEALTFLRKVIFAADKQGHTRHVATAHMSALQGRIRHVATAHMSALQGHIRHVATAHMSALQGHIRHVATAHMS